MSYCGVMSLYQDLAPGGGPNLFALTVKDVTIRGCNMTKDLVYGSEEWKEQFSWTDEFHQFINHNIDNLQCINSVYDGIESMPQQFVDHFTPKTPCSGKSLCRI
jgi:NADPH-dependent curcumin reductase CurA